MPNKGDDFQTPTFPLAFNGGSFPLRRKDIYERLLQSVELVRLSYAGRKELASENDDLVVQLLQCLEDAFEYGLFEQPLGSNTNSVAATAVNLLQNMQEIVIGTSYLFSSNEFTFWDFCQIHLSAHDKQHYEGLKNIWTKIGKGRAFIRAALNEHSLHRYLLTWLSDDNELRRYYSPWSLLCDEGAAKQLPESIGTLSTVLFALSVDNVELNSSRKKDTSAIQREEPIIVTSAPIPVGNTATGTKSKANRKVRQISPSNSINELQAIVNEAVHSIPKTKPTSFVEAAEELSADLEFSPEPIEPYLAFLKEPLPDYIPESLSIHDDSNTSLHSDDFELDRSDTSSQYSKSSASASNSATLLSNTNDLEKRLLDMTEKCASLETQVAKLSLENRQLIRRLKQSFKESSINPTSSLSNNFLITIPQVQLQKSKRPAASSHYVYEVHITMRNNLEHWMVLRRYKEFHKLHQSLLRTHPSMASVPFPPKKHFGNMNSVFVNERRQQLQIYLLNLMECFPQVESCKTKAELQKAFPFLRER